MRWDRAELSNYNKACRSLKMIANHLCTAFSLSTLFLAHSLAVLLRRETAARDAIHDRQRAAICTKPVRDLAIVTRRKHGKVGVFARFHAALAVG